MTNIDQFESVFKAAEKAPFVFEETQLESVLIVSDLTGDEAEAFENETRAFLNSIAGNFPDLKVTAIGGDDFGGVGSLLQVVGEHDPDIVCTYRNLHTPATEYPYSLGTYVDVLTQVSTIPVLLLPHPLLGGKRAPIRGAQSVMAITDHLAGDHHLVSCAATLTSANGTLFLTHIEDETVYNRYASIIGKLPAIDTDEANKAILERLLKEPTDFIESCRQVLSEREFPITIEAIVALGDNLADYKRLIAEHSCDLVLLNTKDADQLAMHGLAYPLSIELRDTPMLLL